MASNAAGEAILFIAGITLAAAFVGVATGTVQDLARGTQDRGDAFARQLNTDVTIVNDPQRLTTNPHVIYVKNTGGSTLTAGDLTVLWDGQVATSVTYDVLGSTDDVTWQPGQVLKVTASGLSTSAGDHRLRVVTENGVGDVLEVRI